MENNFHFFIDKVEIQKSQDSDNQKEMIIQGVASTNDKDLDEEYLEPSGFDLSYFKERGLVNWHHGKNPDDVIGDVIEADIKDNKLYIKAKLYKGSKKAEDAYNLIKNKAENNSKSTVGFSIEGTPIERDRMNPSKILRAKITAVALTHMPKNSQTFAEIVKALGFNEAKKQDDKKVVVEEFFEKDFFKSFVELISEKEMLVERFFHDVVLSDKNKDTIDSFYKLTKAQNFTFDRYDDVKSNLQDLMQGFLVNYCSLDESEIIAESIVKGFIQKVSLSCIYKSVLNEVEKSAEQQDEDYNNFLEDFIRYVGKNTFIMSESDLEKTMSTENAGVLNRESLEGRVKHLNYR